MYKEGFLTNFKKCLYGVVLSLFITVIAIFIFALIVSGVKMEDKTVKIINQLIKYISLLIGVFFSVKSRGVLSGAIIGLFYIFLLHLLFKIFGTDLSIIKVLIDVITTTVIGGTMGAIKMVFKKE